MLSLSISRQNIHPVSNGGVFIAFEAAGLLLLLLHLLLTQRFRPLDWLAADFVMACTDAIRPSSSVTCRSASYGF